MVPQLKLTFSDVVTTMTPPISIYGPGPLAAPSNRPLMDFYFCLFLFSASRRRAASFASINAVFSPFFSRRRPLYAAPVGNLGFGLRGKKLQVTGRKLPQVCS